jgi:hypothetical protein
MAFNPSVFEFKPYANAGSGKIPDAMDFAVVKTALRMPATGAGTFF